ncbi:MAG TPA: STAS domain-containing protein [Actinomycetota bacterium]|nr:STAS domain-containing protein [Actinomycetota bacterium]
MEPPRTPGNERPAVARPEALVLALDGRIPRSAIPALCGRLLRLLERHGAREVICDCAAIVEPDLLAVDLLARLQLTARRRGGAVRLDHVPGGLERLLSLTGLAEVFPEAGRSVVQSRGQPEQREPPRGVEEERDPADPIA